ncbi:MAG: hypothetical protein FWD18_00205 [Micrococcales bacterium]|nr:hypothetical protein [Micrococcales bacterium]
MTITIDGDEMRRLARRLEDAGQVVPNLTSRTPAGATSGAPVLDAAIARFATAVDAHGKKTSTRAAAHAAAVDQTAEDFARFREHLLAKIARLRNEIEALR